MSVLLLTTPVCGTAWSGMYSYDPRQMPSPEIPSVQFEMRFAFRWFGRFSGTITEAPNGVHRSATVVGRLSGRQIAFNKRYDRSWIMRPDGSSYTDPRVHPHVVRYSGELSIDGEQLIGTWIIPAHRFEVDGQLYTSFATTGFWRATRAWVLA